MHEHDKLRQQMAHIGDRYIVRTVGEMPRLRELGAQVPSASAEVLKDLEHLAHKIHGSGAMFGFDAVSDRAGDVEQLAAYLGRRYGGEQFQGLSDQELRSRLIDSIARLDAETCAVAQQRGIDVNAS